MGTSGESSTEELIDDTGINMDKIVWDMNSFSPYKSASPDGIEVHKVLQKIIWHVPPSGLSYMQHTCYHLSCNTLHRIIIYLEAAFHSELRSLHLLL